MVAILLLMVIGVLFFTQSRRTGAETQAAVYERVSTIDDFLKSLEEDSKRAAYIAGFRTFIALEQYVTDTGGYVPDMDASFKEVFLTGSLGNTSFVIMENSSFDAYVSRVQAQALRQGIAFNATVIILSVWQVDPWNVLVNYSMAINASDVRGIARWEQEKTFTGSVPVEDIRDPVFTANTYSRLQRVVKRSDVVLFVNYSENKNDTSELRRHFNNSFYLAAGRGPSVLMRFAGNFSDSPYGIESLVDTQELDAQSLTVYPTRSIVDYQYFGNSSSSATACGIQDMPSYFKLDNASLVVYQVDSNITQTC
jgi:hypothetical protein